MDNTTIQISKELLNKLQFMKMHSKESYEDIIWDLIEDRLEFSEETKKTISEYEKAKKSGKPKEFIKLEDLKKRLRIDV